MKLNNNDDSHNSGLNLLIYNMLLDIESHPTWVCGLKHQCTNMDIGLASHTLRGCVDWNKGRMVNSPGGGCHTLRGCVDWNVDIRCGKFVLPVTPYVGVWIETGLQLKKHLSHPVTPYVGVWIETHYPISNITGI